MLHLLRFKWSPQFPSPGSRGDSERAGRACVALSHCARSMLAQGHGRLPPHQLPGLSVLVTLRPAVSRHLSVRVFVRLSSSQRLRSARFGGRG